MTTEKEEQNEHTEERPEVYNPDDAGRQREACAVVPEERGIKGSDHQEGNPSDASDGDSESADVCKRAEVLCPSIPSAADSPDAPHAAPADAGTSRSDSSLIVDMELLDIRIRIETILQDEAKGIWQDASIDERNSYAKMFYQGWTTLTIARHFCEQRGLQDYAVHDVYKERNQLC